MVSESTTRFPFISLEKALGRARELYDGDRGGRWMPITTAFELWNYSPKSSGGFQTISALKSYGLIDDDGANADRKVKLSGNAKHYFLDERDEERKKRLADFALTPTLFRSLWEKSGWNVGLPADPVSRSHLKIERGLNDQSARALLSILKENVQYAGLSSDDIAPRADDVEDENNGVETTGNERQASPRNIVRPSSPSPSDVVDQRPSKPIVFDMETVSGQYQFDNADDLTDFISKLEKIKALLPQKKNIFD
ncbi:hypothetical protein HFN63_23260 [Rhizobium leguminosarum]|uniref:hypothetical protein n=1 Tax=Rhizobium leguminosarum TaxID=384 RepID=UPI001C981532|nr:hypothetical protein [Rhizobium leguminosarum]MBY5772993.1 hypothetical protein [Rhizobium leguminosarum]